MNNQYALSDEELEFWRPLADADFDASSIHEKNKAIYLMGHRAAFTGTVNAMRLKYEATLNSPPPVLTIFWNTHIDEYEATMKNATDLMTAAILGGMAPAAAKKAIEQVFSDGWTSGSCDENYSNQNFSGD